MKKGFISWLILFLLVITWGSSFILMKKGLTVFSAVQLGALRIAIAYVFLVPFMIIKAKRIHWKKWPLFLISGLIGTCIPAFLFAYAQTGIDSSLSGILNSLTPLFTLLVGMLFFKYKGKWFNILGVFIGLVGAVGLLAFSGKADLSFNFSYAIYIIIATALYATNINLVKAYFQDTDPVSITTFGIGFIGIPVILYLLKFSDFIPTMQHHPDAWSAFGIVAILAIVGTGLALMLYNYLIKISNVVFAASVTYLMPIVAIFWGVIDGESFKMINILWILLVLLGVFLVNRHFNQRDKVS